MWYRFDAAHWIENQVITIDNFARRSMMLRYIYSYPITSGLIWWQDRIAVHSYVHGYGEWMMYIVYLTKNIFPDFELAYHTQFVKL